MPVEIRRRKGLALLAYLAVTGEAQLRDTLAALFWPERSQRQARASLRNEMWRLKEVLGESWLDLGREAVALCRRADLWLDVEQFLQEVSADVGDQTDPTTPDDFVGLTHAVNLYREDFLTGFTLPHCPDFDEWQFFQAESLRQTFSAALVRLIGAYSLQGSYETAILYARRWLALDPLHEAAQRQLMELYAQTGQQAAALRQYRLCAQTLQEELGISPSLETTALYERIRTGDLSEGSNGARGYGDPGSQPVTTLLHYPPAFLEGQNGPAESEQASEHAVFVARERELAELETALATARSGNGQILFVIGGAGRGKTMLVQEFARRAQATDPDLIVVSGYCNAHTGLGDPYLPFREALVMLTGDIEAKSAAGLIAPIQARRLWELMPLTLPALVKQTPDLIGSFVPTEPLLKRAATFASPAVPWFNQLRTMTTSEPGPGLERKQILAQYMALLKIVAARRPLLLILEDLHWVDASSNALLFHLSREVGHDRILIVGSYRPDELALSRGEVRHPLAGTMGELKRQHGDIWLDLGELAPAEGQQFVEAYLDTQPNRLGRAFREALFRRTGGHALFTVELLRVLQERGDLRQDTEGYWVEAAAIDWAKLPARVEGVIETRLSRLSPELQAVLTVASVEGEIFTAEVVARAQQVSERELIQQLSRELDKQHRLVTAQALDRVGQQRLSFYRFRHYLFQHYLYQHLAEAERIYLHEAVGQELERLYGEQTEEVAVELARHFEAAGLVGKAVHYLHQAGRRAGRLSAQAEAVEHFNRGLTLLGTLPETLERDRQEMVLQVALVPSLIITRGYSALEVEQAASRALKLYQAASAEGSAQTVENVSQLFQMLYGLFLIKQNRNENFLALELAEQMLDIAQRQQDPLLLMPAHWAIGMMFYWLGEFALAQEHLEQSMALYDPGHHRSHVLLFGQDQGVHCLVYQGWNLWQLGYPDQALKRSQEAITLAEELAHPYSLLLGLIFNAHLCMRRGDWQAIQEHLETEIALCRDYGFIFWQACPTLHRGKVLAEQGQVEEGIVLIRQFLVAWRGQGAEAPMSYLQSILADAYLKAGQAEEGLNIVAEELAAIEKTAEHFWEPELYRLKGELLLIQPEAAIRGASAQAEAEKCFWQAIEIARHQNGKSLELRAVMSLSRLWQSRGKQAEAKQMLAEIYGWFSEGFDTLDLKEAQALLEELS